MSRYIAEYYTAKGDEVYVLNRNSRQQSEGVHLIEVNRHDLGEILREFECDVVIDTAYNAYNMETLQNALRSYKDYILISQVRCIRKRLCSSLRKTLIWPQINFGVNTERKKYKRRQLY